MPDFGLLTTGFNRKRLADILPEIENAVRAVFGDTINLEPESPDGQINGVTAGSYADIWELIEKVYDTFNPSKAQGIALSNLVQMNGINRLSASPSTVELTLSGVDATLISAGSLVSDGTTQFSIDEDLTISGGVASGTATATVNGESVALAGTITTIETPISGWTGVTNPADAVVGRLEETDAELRERRNRSFALAGQATTDSIFAGISDLEGVSKVTVLENISDSVDADGVPAHGILVIVEGGEDADIANEIWLRKPAGINMGGDVTEVIIDSQNFPQDIKFSRPTPVPIYVNVVTSRVTGVYPVDGDAIMKQNIVDYANGVLVSGEGFGLSEDVIQSRLYTPCNQVPGHDIQNIFIGKSPNPTLEDNIEITSSEASLFLVDNIQV